MTSNSPQQIKSTRTAFRVIDVVKRREPARLIEIADEIDLSKSAVHKHLSTLESLGYISKQEGKYCLGLGFLDLGGHVLENFNLYQVARNEVDDLSDRTGETTLLLAAIDDQATYIYVSEANQGLPPDVRVGAQIDLYSSPPGQAILAHQPRERIERVVQSIDSPIQNENDVLDESAIRRRLEAIRDRGHVFSWASERDDWQSVTAVITGPEDEAIGAITVLGPSSQVDGKRLEVDLTGSVLSTTDNISRKLAKM